MWQQAKHTTHVLVFCGILMPVLTSCTMGTRHATLVGSSPISYVKEGEGHPVIVFESGLGDGMTSWESVYNRVASVTTALAYSRPGYPGSMNRPDPDGRRTASEVAQTLKALLHNTGTLGPYILVGHSVGGLYMLQFAAQNPHDVAGIVLVDGRPPQFRAACKAAGLKPCAPPTTAAALAPSHIAAELRGLADSERQAPSAQALGRIPVTVIAATHPPPGAPQGGQAIWLQTQQAFAEAVTNGRYILADGSGHYIHQDNPELVIMEILLLLETVMGPGASSQ